MTQQTESNQTQELLQQILERMRSKALEMNLQGVAVAAQYGTDGNQNKQLVSQAVDCGKMTAHQWNFLAVAYSKVSEMCDTLQDSGSKVRPAYHGEFGFVGGAIVPAKEGHYIAAFSGAKGEEDLAISRYGLEIVSGRG